MTLTEKLDFLAKVYQKGAFGKFGSIAAEKAYAKTVEAVKADADGEKPYAEMTSEELLLDVLAAPYDSPMSHLYDPRWARGEDRCFTCHQPKADHFTLTVVKVPGERYEPDFAVLLPNGERIGTVGGSGKRWKWGQGNRTEWFGFAMESKREAVYRLFQDWTGR